MKTRLLFLLLIITSIGYGQTIDVLHYKYQINLNDKNDTIYGVAEITFKFNTRTDTAVFDLTGPNKEGKGMEVTAVVYNHPLSLVDFAQENNQVFVESLSGEKGEVITIQIYYKGIPDDGLIISKNKFKERTFFADNWPNRAHHWIPCVDQPNDKASFEFIVSAPSHYKVISNGIKVEEKEVGNNNRQTHWKEDISLPTKVMVIGVARFATKTFDDSPDDLPVSAWIYPQDSTKGFYDYHLATGIVKFFAGYIAPFPYKKLANVQSTTIFGGMENASCIFYAENSVTGDRSSEDLLAHEIAHQWFGDMASEKSFAHLWLSEGFATYFTDLYFEKKYGKEAAIDRLKKEREEAIAFAKITSHAVVDSTKDLMSLLNANSYQKGAWVLHMLRNEVGDETFQKIIQVYYNQYKGSNAETRDFEAVAEKNSGKNLKWFFDQWLYKRGALQLKFKKVQTKNKVQLTIEQAQRDLYQFTLPVSIESRTGKKLILMHVKNRITSITIPNEPILRITIDPNCTLLYEEIK